MQRCILFLAIIQIVITTVSCGSDWQQTVFNWRDRKHAVVPQPTKQLFPGAETTVSPDANIVCEDSTEILKKAVSILRKQLNRDTLSDKANAGNVKKIIISSESMNTFPASEEYTLEIGPEEIKITGRGDKGCLFGVQTLRQLLCPKPDGSVTVPLCTVNDHPDLEWRGIFTTGLVSPSFTRQKLLEAFSLLKINTAVIRVDQALRYEKTPALSNPRSARTKDEYKDFVKLGRSLGMEMIPCSSLYSHFGWAMWTKYGFLAEVPGNNSGFSTPDIDNPQTFPLIKSIMSETIEAFDNPRYYHVGQDELKYSPRPEKPKYTLKEKYRIALKHLKSYCDEFDVTMMMWPDQLDPKGNGGPPENTAEVIDELSRDIILCDWSYFGLNENDFASLDYFTDKGFKTLGCSWYEPHSIEPYISKINSTPGTLGTICTMWAGMGRYLDMADTQLATVWSAENSWSSGSPAYREYENFPTNTFYLAMNALTPLARSYKPVDLSGNLNSNGNDFFKRGEGLAFKDLPKVIRFADFNFQLHNTGSCSAVVLDGINSTGKISAQIKLAPVMADSISFAHITDLPSRRALSFTNLDNKRKNEPSVIAIYSVIYADGTSEEISIDYGEEITDWNEPAGAARAPLVWRGTSLAGKMNQIVGYRWHNTHPQKNITGISIKAGKSSMALALLAISLERTELER